jgi:hypothetical protein
VHGDVVAGVSLVETSVVISAELGGHAIAQPPLKALPPMAIDQLT